MLVQKPSKSAGKSTNKRGAAAAKHNPLDATNIHPESYEKTARLVQMAGQSLNSVGTKDFVQGIGLFLDRQANAQLTKRKGLELE